MKLPGSSLGLFQAKTAAKAAPAANDPDAKAIAAIEKVGGSVRPLAQNDERKEVSFYLQGAAIKDADIAPVAQLKNVAWVHLGKTSVTDAGLAQLKGLSDLVQLHLEGTKITDAGLAHLKGMSKLEYLNVYNTAVTDAGLEHLKSLSSLKSLYVWQTKVTPDGVKKLKAALPKCEVVQGWDLEIKPPAKAPDEKKPEEKKN
ncbi:MAG: hypothetical protein U0Q16_00435 [Bryobacteraceae bacterium]